jgi:orotate phosphoribosyltransferase
MQVDPRIETKIHEILSRIGAIKVRPDDPFLFTSGWKSPIYIDCRTIISFPAERDVVVESMCAIAAGIQLTTPVDFIAGGETGGIAYAAFLADRLSLPMIYVRKKPKEFGTKSGIEGVLRPGSSGILVEDLMTDGRSKEAFCKSVESAGASISNIIVVVSYDIFPSVVAPEKVQSLSTAGQVLDFLIAKSDLEPGTLRELKDFRKGPLAWSVSRGGRAQ